MTIKRIAAILITSLITWTAAAETLELDSDLPDYTKASGLSGNISSAGSDTLANLMTLWAEEFKRLYPNINIQIQAAGSSTAPPALTQSTANFGPMSRKMKGKEIAAFESKFGYKPTAIAVAMDALSVYVNKDNPIKGLSIPQLDAIFSVTRKCDYASDIKTWGQLGLSDHWTKSPLQLYGRNSVSGTYGYFKDRALCKGDYKNNVNEQPGSASVVQSITRSLNGIGYSGVGYKTSGVRAVPLRKKESGEFIEATQATIRKGIYPLSRFLYVYVNKQPNQPLRPLEREFIKVMLSKIGQSIVIKDGYMPLSAKQAAVQMNKIMD